MEALNLATALGELRCTLRGTVENQTAAESTDTGQGSSLGFALQIHELLAW